MHHTIPALEEDSHLLKADTSGIDDQREPTWSWRKTHGGVNLSKLDLLRQLYSQEGETDSMGVLPRIANCLEGSLGFTLDSSVVAILIFECRRQDSLAGPDLH